MYSFVRFASSACLCLVVLALSGCAAPIIVTAGVAAAQAGTGAYASGELRTARHVTMEQAWQATLLALDDLEVETLTTVIRSRSRYVAAREPGGPRFRVTVERKAPMATKFRIRVGFIGDVALSRLTMRRIDYQLAKIASWKEFDDPGNSEGETADVE
jgi:hypothetical protein